MDGLRCTSEVARLCGGSNVFIFFELGAGSAEGGASDVLVEVVETVTILLREAFFSTTEHLDRLSEACMDIFRDGDKALSVSVGGGDDSGSGLEDATGPGTAAILTTLRRCQESSISPTLSGSQRRAERLIVWEGQEDMEKESKTQTQAQEEMASYTHMYQEKNVVCRCRS